MKPVRAGVVGVGKMGEYHVGVLTELTEVEITGIVDINQERARAISEKYSIPFHPDPQALFDRVDVVIIAVPTVMHYPLGKEFLNAGIHVLLQFAGYGFEGLGGKSH